MTNGIYSNKKWGQEDLEEQIVRSRYGNGNSVFRTCQGENKITETNLISKAKIIVEVATPFLSFRGNRRRITDCQLKDLLTLLSRSSSSVTSFKCPIDPITNISQYIGT